MVEKLTHPDVADLPFWREIERRTGWTLCGFDHRTRATFRIGASAHFQIPGEAAETIAAWNTRATDPAVAGLVDGLERAIGWFQDYGNGHSMKGADDKAKRNFDRADELRAALATYKETRNADEG